MAALNQFNKRTGYYAALPPGAITSGDLSAEVDPLKTRVTTLENTTATDAEVAAAVEASVSTERARIDALEPLLSGTATLASGTDLIILNTRGALGSDKTYELVVTSEAVTGEEIGVVAKALVVATGAAGPITVIPEGLPSTYAFGTEAGYPAYNKFRIAGATTVQVQNRSGASVPSRWSLREIL